MYKCVDCGHIFEDGEQATWYENRGEFWGASCNELTYGCPICKGDYRETKRCKVCGSEFFSEDLFEGMCEDCIYEHENDLELMYEIGKNQKEKVSLNCFLTHIFNEKEIEEILLNKLKESKRNNFADFINADKEWFAKFLRKELEK